MDERTYENGDLQHVQTMINQGIIHDWNRGLCLACSGGHLQLVQLMIDCGADEWHNGLWYACYGGHLQIVQLMIDRGANGWNIGLWNACQTGHLEIVQFLIDKGADNLDQLSTEDVFWLLEHGTSVRHFQTHDKFNKLLKDIKTFRDTISVTKCLLVTDLLNLVSEYSLN